ncbi:MAG: toll/interleukin-1 receptor domain-containing protein [Desulfobacterales bacterium]|nr:toll/interleukin-1 receptor domain-containing protein [Desulfobacterales bacterium]
MSAKIFISYGEEDSETAKRLYDDLKASGFDPWMNRENILPGQNRKLEIRQAILESSYFLVLLSEKFISGRGYFQKELKTALEILEQMPPSDIFILPVRLDDCKPSYENLQDIQHTDLFPSYEKGFRKIVRALESPGDEKESRRFVSKSVMGTLAGIRIESGEDSVFAKDSGKAGIVKDSQAGVIGDSAKVEGGVHQQTQDAKGAQGAVQAENIGKVEQHYHRGTPFAPSIRFWIVAGVIVLACLIFAVIFFTVKSQTVKNSQIIMFDEEISARVSNFKMRLMNAGRGFDLGQAVSALGIMPNDTQYSRIEFKHCKFTHLLTDLKKAVPDKDKSEISKALAAHKKLLMLRPDFVGERAWDENIAKDREELLNNYIKGSFNIRNWVSN